MREVSKWVTVLWKETAWSERKVPLMLRGKGGGIEQERELRWSKRLSRNKEERRRARMSSLSLLKV